jgi:hypothetical protein
MGMRRRGIVKGGLGTVIAAGVGMPLYLPAGHGTMKVMGLLG